MEDVVGIREAIPIIPKMEITVIREGTPVQITEKQREYRESRAELFRPYVRLDEKAVRRALEARRAEIEEAIQNSPLGAAADRNGNSLGNLGELTSIALRELDGELKSRFVLGRTLEMITEEEEQRVESSARDTTREGIVIDRESGAIQIRKFPNGDRRETARAEASNVRDDFARGKSRMLQYVAGMSGSV